MKRILASKPTVVRLATAADREQIYRLRHDIYAGELGQHATNGEGRLRDALDELNVYLVASRNDDIAGFVSITGPEGGRFSVENTSAARIPPRFTRSRRLGDTRNEARRQGCRNQWPDGEHPRPCGVRLQRGPPHSAHWGKPAKGDEMGRNKSYMANLKTRRVEKNGPKVED